MNDPAHAVEGVLATLDSTPVGRQGGWGIVRWTTADDNYRARGLYDQVGHKTRWNLYELTV